MVRLFGLAGMAIDAIIDIETRSKVILGTSTGPNLANELMTMPTDRRILTEAPVRQWCVLGPQLANGLTEDGIGPVGGEGANRWSEFLFEPGDAGRAVARWRCRHWTNASWGEEGKVKSKKSAESRADEATAKKRR